MSEKSYLMAKSYAYLNTKDSATRAKLFELLDLIARGENITFEDVKRRYPSCYRHVLNLRREGILVLVRERPSSKGILKFRE